MQLERGCELRRSERELCRLEQRGEQWGCDCHCCQQLRFYFEQTASALLVESGEAWRARACGAASAWLCAALELESA